MGAGWNTNHNVNMKYPAEGQEEAAARNHENAFFVRRTRKKCHQIRERNEKVIDFYMFDGETFRMGKCVEESEILDGANWFALRLIDCCCTYS